MINLFTAEPKIKKIQKDVLRPLYTTHPDQDIAQYSWLLAETGRAISKHQTFIEELCRSRFVAIIFKIIKILGGADKLTEEDFSRFTSYVNDGGITAMVKMLLGVEKEKIFIDELQRLPLHIQKNAPLMLIKSKALHRDFISGFFQENYGSLDNTPKKLLENLTKSENFINRLAGIASQNLLKLR